MKATYIKFALFAMLLAALQIGSAAPSAKKLGKALDRGDAATVAKLLQEDGAAPIAVNEVLNRARASQAAAVQMLLDAGANAPDLKEQALAEAARAGSVDVVRLLIERGAKVDWQAEAITVRPNAPGWTPPPGPSEEYANLGPFEVPAGQVAHMKRVKLPNAGNSALSMAVVAKQAQVVRLLLEKGASKDLLVIYKDPEFAALSMLGDSGRRAVLEESGGMHIVSRDQTGREILFQSVNGAIVTNAPFAFEKRASIRDLAKMVGDETINGQF